MTVLQRIGICVAGVFLLVLAAVMPQAMAADSVRGIIISGEIDGSQVALVRRAIALSREHDDQAVIVTIHTQGGRVDSALEIRDILQHAEVPTIAYVEGRAWSAGALIALACRHIVMAPGSSIGAAEPIPNTEKNIAAIASEFKATAESMGHNAAVAEAMVDKSKGYPGYAEEGKILALTDKQARELAISEGTADTPEQALHLYSLDDAAVTYEERSWIDEIRGILQNDYVRTIFIGIILTAVFLAIKSGIGLGLGTVFILSSLLLFSGYDTLSDELLILGAFISSIIFIVLEMVLPGGICGVIGVVLLFGSLFFMLGATLSSVYILAAGTVLAVVLCYVLGRYVPKSRMFDKVTLKNRSTKEKGYTACNDMTEYLYQHGETITDLKPEGYVRINKKRVNARAADGTFIERNIKVRVIKLDDYCVVVEPEPSQKK